MNFAVILAGGTGTRFWPLSTDVEPKQFLGLCSKRPMLDETVERVGALITKKNIYIAANKLHTQKIKKCLQGLYVPSRNIFFEPRGKNTLAPIAYLAERINKLDNDSVIVVLPCDHYIKNNIKFLNSLKAAIDIANQGYIVTMGIRPTRPETGYGYIESAEGLHQQGYFRVKSFIEKPPLKTAERFCENRKYYWNCGIFVFRSGVLLEETRRLAPEVYRVITQPKIKDAKRLWEKLPSLSIDYGIMEKTRKAVVLPVDFGWQDIGSWQSISEVMQEDKRGSVFVGKCIDIDSKNCLVWSDRRLVTTIGLDNIIVVDTKDALLVCSKDKAQDVKKLVQILKKKRLA
jgi:mannose-1-phosphate guanylyltransferase